MRVDGRYQTTENPVLVPGAGLEPAWSRLRGIFVLATAFAAERRTDYPLLVWSLDFLFVVSRARRGS